LPAINPRSGKYSPLTKVHSFVLCRRLPHTTTQYLRNYNLYNNRCAIWEAARATSATPGIFKPVKIAGTRGISAEYVDPGLEHSNPTEKLLEEASGLFGQDRRVKCVLSIGTGRVSRRWKTRATAAPYLASTVLGFTTSCELKHETFAERLRAQSSQTQFYFRLNLVQVDVELQDWNQIDRLSAAVKRQLAIEPMKTEIGALADLLCARDGSPTRKYHTFKDLGM
jgi:hypothetical protein